MIGPNSKYTSTFEKTRKLTNGTREVVAVIYYQIYGGEFDGVELYDYVNNDWVFVPRSQFDELSVERYQGLINEHLEAQKEDGKEYEYENEIA